jgi:hypothetical protein
VPRAKFPTEAAARRLLQRLDHCDRLDERFRARGPAGPGDGASLDEAKAGGSPAYARGRLASVHLAVLTERHRQLGGTLHVDPVEQLLATLGGPSGGGFDDVPGQRPHCG